MSERLFTAALKHYSAALAIGEPLWQPGSARHLNHRTSNVELKCNSAKTALLKGALRLQETRST